MKNEKNDARNDRAAEKAKQTVEHVSSKVGHAAQCGSEKTAQTKQSAKTGLHRTADKVRQTVEHTTDRIRKKLSD